MMLLQRWGTANVISGKGNNRCAFRFGQTIFYFIFVHLTQPAP